MSGEQGKAAEKWQEKTLADVVSPFAPIVYGIVQAGPEVENGVPYIKSSNVGGEIITQELSRTSEEIAQKYIRAECQPGDIVFSLRGNIGDLSIVPDHLKRCNLTQGTARIRVDDRYSKEFTAQYLRSEKIKQTVDKVAKGSTFREISLEQLRKLPIVLPPLPEQRKISTILSTWDDSLATLTNLLAAKRQQKRGLAEALLTGKKRLKGFAGEWESHLLGLLMPQKPKETAGETEYPILSVTVEGIKPQGDHFNKRVASEKTSDYLVVRRGEIAMSGLNFWMGAIDMQTIEDAGVISPAYKVFRTNPKKFNSDFARHFIRSEKMRQILLDSSIQGASIVRRNLDMQSLKESEVMVPTVPEQQAIASILSTLDGEIASLEALKAKVQEQKRGLMDELLTGRVRVAVNDA